MTVSRLSLKLCLVALALGGTACADVGGSNVEVKDEFPVVKSTDQDVIVCQSIRVAIQKDKKAAEAAQAAGNTQEAKSKLQSVATGVEGAKSVKNCDVSDLVGAASSAPSPS